MPPLREDIAERQKLSRPPYPELRWKQRAAATQALAAELRKARAEERKIGLAIYESDPAYATERAALSQHAWEQINATRPDLVRPGLDHIWFEAYHCESTTPTENIPSADRVLAEKLCEAAAELLRFAASLQISIASQTSEQILERAKKENRPISEIALDGARPGGDSFMRTFGGRRCGTNRQWAAQLISQIDAAEWRKLHRRMDEEDRARVLRDALQRLFAEARKERTRRRRELQRSGSTKHRASAQSRDEVLARIREPMWRMTNAAACVADENTLSVLMAHAKKMFDGDKMPRVAAIQAAGLAIGRHYRKVSSSVIRDAQPVEGTPQSFSADEMEQALRSFREKPSGS